MRLQPSLLLVALASAACGTSEAAAPQDAAFTMVAEWSPLVSTYSGFHLDRERGLAEALNPGVARETARYTWDDVAALLPGEDVQLGDVWEPGVEPIVAMLRQLHPSATARLHHHHGPLPPGIPEDPTDDSNVEALGPAMPGAPLGARATLLARGPVVDVLLRAHVEFDLRNGTIFYTPAQFEGRLVVEPATRTVRAFHLAVPDRDTNVDLNLHEPGEESGEVDIGYCPRLGLWTKAAPPERDAVQLDVARSRLRCAFYPFATTDWPTLDDAYGIAWQTKRPLHVIVLFGALDDESC